MGEVIYIDVSQYQGKIDWTKVKAAGVFIRAAYRGYSAGVNRQDSPFVELPCCLRLCTSVVVRLSGYGLAHFD